MYPKIIPRNNEWNRKYSFSEENGTGFLMDLKLQQAFFAWIFPDGNIKCYKCEQGVFENNFAVDNETIGYEFDPYENIHFLRYPVEM